jgi:integrase
VQKRDTGEYRFNPPQNLVDAGVVTRKTFGTDLQQVRRLVRKDNEAIDNWRDIQSQVLVITDRSTFNDLVDYYYMSNDFNMLRDTTKVDYKYFLGVVCDKFNTVKYKNISTKVAKGAYEEWVKRGVSFANHTATCASRVFNYAIEMEHAILNPFSNIKRKASKKRTVVWATEDVVNFLDVAYASFDTRNIGLIIQMAYEWCQRLGDMRMLEWDNINLTQGKLELEQSKRRADVSLPISDNLLHMLKQQQNDFGFQKYVAPHPRPVAGSYNAYAMERLSKVGRRVMRLAGLPEELRLMDLRRTGVTQMIDKGVPLPQVMSVTGHTHVSSVQPYMKHTYMSANNALTQRSDSLKSTVCCNNKSDTL